MTTLLALLQNIQQLCQQLLNCLEQEKSALDTNQADNLLTLSSQKQTLVDQLTLLDKQRMSFSTHKNFDSFIADSNNQKLIAQWNFSRESIAACQQQNEINGRLLNKRSQINQEILSIFSGQPQQRDETYNAQGNQTNRSSLFNGIKA